MDFNRLVELSRNLEMNIFNLEHELRDASKFIYQGFNDDNKAEGLNILKNLNEQWKIICEEMEEANSKDEQELESMQEELRTFENGLENLIQCQRQNEEILQQHNLLELKENSNVQNSTPESPGENGYGGVSPEDNTFFLPTRKSHSTPCDSDSDDTTRLF